MKPLKIVRPDPAASNAAPQFQRLRGGFSSTVDFLKRRRADLLAATAVDAYVKLDWLAWHGGSLKVTTVGENVYAQLRNEAAALAGP